MRVVVCILGLFAVLTRGELYTALADLEDILDTEAVFLQTLDKYIHQQENRLKLLRLKTEEYKKEHNLASSDVSSYLSNPINAYLLIKRLTSDWKMIEKLMSNDIVEDALQNMTEIRKHMKFPTDEDLTGAVTALIRLQDTYAMDTASLARGELMGIQYTTQLSASDCFELGRQSYNKHDFYHTVLWMSEALKRHEKENSKTDTARWEILEYLSYSTYMQGNIHSALEMTDELLQIVPDHQRALGNRTYYKNAIENGLYTLTEHGENSKKNDPYDSLIKDNSYKMACRGALSPPPTILSKLKCRYKRSNHFLRLAPLKEEDVYLKPRIVLYRDSMADLEIELIKKLALPQLKRATVLNSQTGEEETALYRISKVAWLNESKGEVISRITQRVEDMTGLTTAASEMLQVANYGIGGHYAPHCDFARKEDAHVFKFLGSGNRIATVLFYMSDVAQGGATVFPKLKVGLWPAKGTAAFWYNLREDGKRDYDTRHAACPVLVGSKWVSNKWLHEKGQEFRRPCLLRPGI